MLLIKAFFISTFLFILSTKNANAIIAIIPVVLVPIVSIVVWIIGALTTPVLALTAIYFKLKKKSIYYGVLAGIVILILSAVLIIIILKLANPERPLY
jgi:hypothetical protein